MSLAEAKQVLGTLILGSAVIAIALLYIAYKFAEISYKKAHKTKKVHKAKRNINVIFNIDSKDKTLQEVQAEQRQMKRLLGGI